MASGQVCRAPGRKDGAAQRVLPALSPDPWAAQKKVDTINPVSPTIHDTTIIPGVVLAARSYILNSIRVPPSQILSRLRLVGVQLIFPAR